MKRNLILLSILCLSFLQSIESEAVVRLHNNHTFGDWHLYEGKDNKTKVCYAIVEPYRTRAFHGLRSKPWLAITFLGHNKFTVSGNSGFDVNSSTEWILDVDNISPISLHILPNGEVRSYSSIQDVQIINALMQGELHFTVRSYSTSKQTALDYYSLKGLQKIITYMNNHC